MWRIKLKRLELYALFIAIVHMFIAQREWQHVAEVKIYEISSLHNDARQI